jgi:ABC-type multidrug transport system ATPase subunit
LWLIAACLFNFVYPTGKTSLLNAITLRAGYCNVTGTVQINGREVQQDDFVYVPQECEVKGYATVYENLEFVGLMTCTDIPEMRYRRLKLLETLGILGKSKTECRFLSGGQLKRLHVAMALLSKPTFLILDG